MNLLNQIYYTAKRLLIDVRPVVIKIVSFMIIILILGSAFQEDFESSDLDQVTILYCNKDEGQAGASFINELISMDEMKEYAKFEEVSSYDKAEKMVKDEKADALLYLPEDFTEQTQNQDESNVVEVYRSKYSGTNQAIIESLVETYVNGLNTAGAVYKMTGSLENFQFDLGNGFHEEPLTTNGKVPGSMGYYAIAMLLMMMAYGAEYGNNGIGEEVHGTIGDRMKLSQIRPFEQYVGKVIGLALVTLIQALIIVVFTTIGYNVDWGPHYGLLVFVLFTYSTLTTTFGGMIAMLTNDTNKGNTVVNTCVMVFTFLAGGFIAMDFGVVKYFSLNTYAQTALTNIIYQGSISRAYEHIGFMWLLTLAFIIISLIAARRKRA